MKIKHQVTLDRIIGKVDNDFNISESDWIPRAAAWIIDALSQLKCLPFEKKRRELEVSERIATFPCTINSKELKVFDTNGCEIPELNSNTKCCSGLGSNTTSSEISVLRPDEVDGFRTIVGTIVNPYVSKNFVLSGNNIELNFDTDKIITESLEVATYYDEYYDCEVPYVYDNGLLLEAISWYILFKYLSRGSKHQVYSIQSNNPVTNPYIQWNNIKSKAAASVKIDLSKADSGWNNFFYNSTFLPRG